MDKGVKQILVSMSVAGAIGYYFYSKLAKSGYFKHESCGDRTTENKHIKNSSEDNKPKKSANSEAIEKFFHTKIENVENDLDVEVPIVEAMERVAEEAVDVVDVKAPSHTNDNRTIDEKVEIVDHVVVSVDENPIEENTEKNLGDEVLLADEDEMAIDTEANMVAVKVDAQNDNNSKTTEENVRESENAVVEISPTIEEVKVVEIVEEKPALPKLKLEDQIFGFVDTKVDSTKKMASGMSEKKQEANKLEQAKDTSEKEKPQIMVNVEPLHKVDPKDDESKRELKAILDLCDGL